MILTRIYMVLTAEIEEWMNKMLTSQNRAHVCLAVKCATQLVGHPKRKRYGVLILEHINLTTSSPPLSSGTDEESSWPTYDQHVLDNGSASCHSAVTNSTSLATHFLPFISISHFGIMEVLPRFTPNIQISASIEVEMANHQFRRDNSAIDMVKGVVGADNSRRASRLRRQRLKTTGRLAAPAAFPAASIGEAGEYIRPSDKVAEELRTKASAEEDNSKKSTQNSPLNGRKQGWNHARVGSYGSLNTLAKDSVTTPLLGAPSYDSSTTPSVFDTEHSTSRQQDKAAVYSWNKWMKIYVGFLLAIFLTFRVLIATKKVATGREKAVEDGNGSAKSSAGTSTEAPSFWYTLAVAMTVGFADLIFDGGFGEL